MFKSVTQGVGGPSQARTPGGTTAITNTGLRYPVQSTQVDAVKDLLVHARKKIERVVLRHEDTSADLWILGADVMCRDLANFSTSVKLEPSHFYSPLFNMGRGVQGHTRRLQSPISDL